MAKFEGSRTSQQCESADGFYSGENRLSSGSERSKRLGGSERPAKELALGAGSGTMRIRPENSAGDAGKENRASKAISARLCSKGKAWPQMGVDWKVPRGWNREDKGPWPLCGSDGGSIPGKIAQIEALECRNQMCGQGLIQR